MKQLILAKGVVIYDDQDHELIDQYRWHVSDLGYAVWRGRVDGVQKTIRMHRLIMQCPDKLVVDHLNHNRLDNRRANLRICTQAENTRNRKEPGRGYWFQKQNSNWVVELNGRHIGVFDTEVEAADIVALIRSGGTYRKPERTHCKYGHLLADAYVYGGSKICRACQSRRSRRYFKNKYIPRPRKHTLLCPRGHNKLETRTANGDCRLCASIRSKEQRIKNHGRNKVGR